MAFDRATGSEPSLGAGSDRNVSRESSGMSEPGTTKDLSRTCACPSEFCKLEPDNGAELCPELEPNEVCAYRLCPICLKPGDGKPCSEDCAEEYDARSDSEW